jgi:hypothetical protein
LFFIIIAVKNPSNSQAPAQDKTSSQTSNLNDNLTLQNECISQAQAEVNNDPTMQPIGDSNLYLSERANAMQPKIADCKAKYPTN